MVVRLARLEPEAREHQEAWPVDAMDFSEWQTLHRTERPEGMAVRLERPEQRAQTALPLTMPISEAETVPVERREAGAHSRRMKAEAEAGPVVALEDSRTLPRRRLPRAEARAETEAWAVQETLSQGPQARLERLERLELKVEAVAVAERAQAVAPEGQRADQVETARLVAREAMARSSRGGKNERLCYPRRRGAARKIFADSYRRSRGQQNHCL